MGGLLTAGLISGAGEGISRAANAVLTIAGESLLQKDREDWETKRRAQTEKFAINREQRLNEFTAARDTTAFERQRQLEGEEQTAHLQREQGLLTQKQDFEREKQTEELRAKDASLDKTHGFELMKQQADMGRDLVLHSMRLQDARQSSTLKLDPRVQARIDFQMAKLKGLQDRLKEGLLDPDQLTAAKEEVEQIGRTIDQLLGVEDPRSTSKPIIDPDDIHDRFRRSRQPTSSAQ